MANELKGISGIDIAVNAIVEEVDKRKAELLADIVPLATIVTTADNLTTRKADRASVNKRRGEFDKERIALEKKWKSAIAPVSNAYKEVVAECDSIIAAIDKDLDGFEQKRLEAKRALIGEIFTSVEVPEEISGWIFLMDIYNQKWENAGTTEKQIRKEIEDAYTALKISYDTLVSLNHRWQTAGIEELKTSKDLQKAIAKMNSLAEQERIIEEKRKADEERRAEEERARKRAELEAQLKPEKGYEEMEFVAEPEPLPFPFGMPEEPVEEFPFGAPVEEEQFTEAERWLVSKVFQDYYCMGINDIANEDATAASLFKKIGLI